MPTCPTCLTQYADDTAKCPTHGVDLVPDATFAHVDKDVAPGTVVGEYTIESKLGEGGFGAVYSATHPLIGKRAAVKILSRELSSNPQMVSRFIAEARAVNQIRHRNIIDIFSFGQLPDGRQYYIMELLDGMSFDAYLAQRKRLDLEEAMPIFRGIARALDAAHAKGILHRDLKPENVFLVVHEDKTVEPKLLDFGLVKLLDAKGEGSHNTKTGTPMGTPYYMSPEQCRGLDVDARTDVYSFGALVFEVLTGDVPFQGQSTMDILMQHVSAPPPSASARAHGVSVTLDGPIARIMAKDPADRPPSVGAAVELLASAAGLSVESARSLRVDSSDMSPAERAVAPTMIAPVPSATPPVQTFLGGAETEIAEPPQKRSLLPLVAVVAALVGGIVVVALTVHKSPPPTALVQSAPPSATIAAEPPKPVETKPATVDLKVDGVPADTVVTADDKPLGTGGGPFRVKRDAPVKLGFSAPGFKSKELTVTPDENMLLSVTLEKASSASVPAPTHHAAPAPKKVHSDLESF